MDLGPELKKWGYEIMLDQLLEAMNPENYDVVKKEKGYLIMEKYSILDEEKEPTGEFEWRRRYSHDHDTKHAGYFSTHSKAIKAIEKVIEQAAEDFDQVVRELKDLPDV